MIRITAYPLLAAAMFLSSCTPRSTDNRQGDNAQPKPAAPSHSANRSLSDSATPAAGSKAAASQSVDGMSRHADSQHETGPVSVLPLQQGVFVETSLDCSAPANAGFRFYDGRGISGSATHDCRTLVRSRRGDIFSVEQSCIDTPSGPGPRTSESQTIRVRNASNFTLTTADESTRFRHCPPHELPEYLRQRMAR